MDYETGPRNHAADRSHDGRTLLLRRARRVSAYSAHVGRLLYRRRSALARRRYDHSRTLARRAIARYVSPPLHRAGRDGADRRDVYPRAGREPARRGRALRLARLLRRVRLSRRRASAERRVGSGRLAHRLHGERPNDFVSSPSDAEDRAVVGWYAYGANLTEAGW